jgi:hypothetical protein
MNHFDIRLTPQELDFIANMLAQQPWAQVNALLTNIKSQIDYQQKAALMPATGPDQADGPRLADFPAPGLNGHN